MKTEDLGVYQVLKIYYDYLSGIQERRHQNVITAALRSDLFKKPTVSQLMSRYTPFPSA